MIPWLERSQVRAAYLNPAFIALLIAVACDAYEKESGGAMEWPLAFLIPPIVLHGPTRSELPKDTRTHLSTWLSRRPLLRATFPQRATELVPTVREALRFGSRHGLLTFEEHFVKPAQILANVPEPTESMRPARLVGRWFGKTDRPATIFALFGVEP